MANSRSNIYPVQLQGAELNLNKLDAEIKQYSEFNKNNAPFVGGCLSNIFTKDETIEGATSKNTYIAPNGDVYRVNTEGLWKNDEKLVDYTGKKFYDVVECKTQFPANTVFVDSEECYITRDFNVTYQYFKFDFYLNVFNLFSNEWNKISIPVRHSSSDSVADFYIDVKCCKNDTTMLIFVLGKYANYNVLCVFKVTEEGTVLLSETTVNIGFTPILHLELTDSDTGIITILRNSANSSGGNDNILGYNYQFNMNGEISLMGNLTGLPLRFSVDKSYCDKVVASDQTLAGYDYTIHNGAFSFENPIKINNWEYSNFSVIRQVGKLFGFIAILRKINNDVTKYRAIALCDFLTPLLSYKQVSGTYANGATLNAGAVVGDYVLYNNGVVSGICLPGGIILASEWNTVEEYNIYKQSFKNNYNGVYMPDSNTCIIYKSNETWYKINESSPKLKVINNQLIINVNYHYNSYNLLNKDVLLFAPAWNNRFPGTNTLEFDYTDTPTETYVASAINEYNLQNNSSIIINPIPVMKSLPNQLGVNLKDIYNLIFVNFYTGDTEILYRFSRNIDDVNISETSQYNFVIENLIDLPFPTNTDGNIQYSPSLFATEKGKYGNLVFISEGGTAYKLMTYDNKAVMSYFLSTAVEGLQDFFTIQGQLYGILDNQIYNFSIVNEIANRGDFIVSVEGLQFVGNTPYEALFFSNPKSNSRLRPKPDPFI